jgi:Tfp pilus assembly protein PilP
MKMTLRWPHRRRALPRVSARPGPATAWPLACALAAGVGTPLALLGPDLKKQLQDQQLRTAELARTRAAALGRLELVRTRVQSDAAPPIGLPRPADAAQVQSDRLMLHRVALQHGLRVQVLKARTGTASGVTTEPGSARRALSVELTGSVEAASGYLMALGRAGPPWSLQRLEVLAGAAGRHRLVMQLEPLALGRLSAAPWVHARMGPAQALHDPFAAVPAPPVPAVVSAEPTARAPVEPPWVVAQPVGPAPMPAHWQAELNRERQPLEAFALRDLFLTGTLRQGKSWLALVRAGGVIHTLRVGEYVGPDLGLVRSVDEEGLDLREIGRDNSGQWVELPRRWRVGVSP